MFSQFRSHFFRQVKDNPQVGQIFEGRKAFLCMFLKQQLSVFVGWFEKQKFIPYSKYECSNLRYLQLKPQNKHLRNMLSCC